MTPDASPPPPSQTWGPVVEYSLQRKGWPNGYASLGEPIDQGSDGMKALEAYMYWSNSGSVLIPRKTRGNDVH